MEGSPDEPKGLGGPHCGPGGVGRASQKAGMCCEAPWKVGRGWESPRKTRRNGRLSRRASGWGGPPAGLGVVRRARRGQESLPEGWERSRGTATGSGGDRKPIWRAVMGREALLEEWVGSGGCPKGLGGVGKPSRRDGGGRVALQEVWEGSCGPPGGTGDAGRPIRRAVRGQEGSGAPRRAMRSLEDLLKDQVGWGGQPGWPGIVGGSSGRV